MTKVGDIIELVHTSDPYTKLKPGDRGMVGFIDSLGTVAVRWDNGSTLGLVPDEDTWKIVGKGGNQA